MSFKTRGPITPADGLPYISRPADDDLAQLVQNVDYVALIGPYQSGKTSMLMHLREQLIKLPRYVITYVSLSQFSTLDEARWYEHFFNAFVYNANADLPRPSVPAQDAIDLRDELIDLLKGALANRLLIVFLDDVEAVPIEFRTAFFATLREMFVSRGIEPLFRRLAFVLAGSYIPKELIPDDSISPFRIAEKVYIEDASFEAVLPLLACLDQPRRPMASDVPRRIYDWTEGDLALIQRLCKRLDRRYREGTITPAAVDQVVERYLFDDDIFSSLEARMKQKPQTMQIVHDVVQNVTRFRFNRINQALAHGWLLGCIKPNMYQNCAVRNPIYEHALREILRAFHADGGGFSTTTSDVKVRTPLQGRFALEKTLKRNAMNHIYLAHDLQINAKVVVKQMVLPNMGDLVAWRRFQREADILKQLNHPHIVRFISTFREAEFNYIVMEYVDGGTADLLLSLEGRQPISVIVGIILGVADALAYVHEHGIVHRDIKPSNILLTGELTPRLADFGVAYLGGVGDRITEIFSIVGTPAYLCPEGYSAEGPAPTEDVWSLGVTFYELLTGTLPFNGQTYDEMRAAVQNNPVPDVRSIRPDVPHLLADLLKRMLSRDPAQRPPNGRAIHMSLSAIQKVL